MERNEDDFWWLFPHQSGKELNRKPNGKDALRWEDFVHGGQLEDFVGSVLEGLRQTSLQTGRQLVQEETRVVVDELIAHLAQHRVTVEQVLHIELTLLDLYLDGKPLGAHERFAVPIVALAEQLDTCSRVLCICD